MFVGLLQFELDIPHAASLKDKRRVLKSLRDRLHREHLIAIAEIDANERWRTGVMGAAVVSNSEAHARGVLDDVVRKLGRLPEARLADFTIEVIRGDQPPAGRSLEPVEELWDERDRRSTSAEDAA